MMMSESGAMFLGYPVEISIMFLAGVVYLVCAAIIWKPMRKERNELIGALFAFLIYQALAMILSTIGMETMNMTLENLSALAIFIGSAYMLRFPFSYFGSVTRKILFTLSLIAVFVLFGWFISSPDREMQLSHFITIYDIVVNGIVVGFFMFRSAIIARDSWVRVKAMGGGAGVASCCVVSNIASLGGAFTLSSVFAFLAPVIIVSSLMLGRRMQKQRINGMN
jgi:hypothetical protein